MKPPFAYYGGKTLLARRIASMMPHHNTYIEPFFGSAHRCPECAARPFKSCRSMTGAEGNYAFHQARAALAMEAA